MSHRTAFAVLVLMASGAAFPASAQTCSGTAPFSAGLMRAGVGASFGNDLSSYGGLLSVGASRGPFATGSIARISIDGEVRDAIAPAYGLTAGWAVEVGPEANPSSLQLCTIVGWNHLGGPDIDLGDGTELRFRSNSLAGGFAIGLAKAMTPALSLVPTASFACVAEGGSAQQTGSAKQEFSDTYVVFDAGLGLVFRESTTVGLSLSRPVGFEDAATTVSVSFSVNFGPAR